MYNICMSISDNTNTIKNIQDRLDRVLPIKLGVNKRNELTRLIYELCSSNKMSVEEVFAMARIGQTAEEGRSGLFHKLKKHLVSLRYPTVDKGRDLHIMPLKIKEGLSECPLWDTTISPENIYVEKEVKDLAWTKQFLSHFPSAKVSIIDALKDGLKKFSGDGVSVYNARRKNVFLVKNKAAFIKVCPCTKKYKRCGYWILNIGFGCPMDCSYCYLQMYSNAPGLILTANIEDYYDHIKEFDDRAEGRIRIGTGEFTDSMALDKYTRYSEHLIPFFKNTKNLVLELKTKVSDIDNVLKQEPHDNLVVSWSINTLEMSDRFEKGAATMEERISAALSAAKKGFKLGFHFDPVVYYDGWEQGYKDIVDAVFSIKEISEKIEWISIGTLRYTPGLKQIAENRFSDNDIYYQGEFSTDSDGKLRYPREIRIDIYKKMIEWIRSHNTKSWIYLCMEPAEMWREVGVDSWELK